jgi:hypothetical protein
LPGTAGDTMTRDYLARELAALGFEPGAADGTWEQPVELVGVTTNAPAKWRFARGGESVELERNGEFIAASGVQQARSGVANAELVFVGYGIEAPEYSWDDFKGVDVSGKVLMMLNNDPDWDPALFAGAERLYYGRWMYKYQSAARSLFIRRRRRAIRGKWCSRRGAGRSTSCRRQRSRGSSCRGG